MLLLICVGQTVLMKKYPHFFVNLKGAVCGNDSQGCACLCTARKTENATEERSRYVKVFQY